MIGVTSVTPAETALPRRVRRRSVGDVTVALHEDEQLRSWWEHLDERRRRDLTRLAYRPLPSGLALEIARRAGTCDIVVSEASGVEGVQWFLSREAARFVTGRVMRVSGTSRHR